MQEKVKYSSAFHYVRGGQCWISFSGEDYLLGPGDLVFVGRGGDHILSSSNGAKYLTFMKVQHIFYVVILVFVILSLHH